MKTRMGHLERQFFASVQARQVEIVRQGDLVAWLGLSPLQERGVFHRLAAARWIVRIRRGLYLAPSRLPLAGVWNPDEGQVLSALVGGDGGRYQICGPNAFQRHGFDGQMSVKVFAYNNRLSGLRRIGNLELVLIKVADAKLGGTEAIRMASGAEVLYSSRARTLVDAVDDWARFHGLPRAYEWIKGALARKEVKTGELADAALRFGNQACRRRMGMLLAAEGASGVVLKRLEAGLRSSKSIIPWDPTTKAKGSLNRRWGVIVNVSV